MPQYSVTIPLGAICQDTLFEKRGRLVQSLIESGNRPITLLDDLMKEQVVLKGEEVSGYIYWGQNDVSPKFRSMVRELSGYSVHHSLALGTVTQKTDTA